MISTAPDYRWPEAGSSRIPYWIYSDPAIYAREQERLFSGSSWNYIGFESEIPAPGDFKRTFVGERSVVAARDRDGHIHVFLNTCAHRGVQFCRHSHGNAKSFVCPYHQWVYDLKGNLVGVPFRKGVQGQGGMPEDFDLASHGLVKLKAETVNGAIFATFDQRMVPFRDYLGDSMYHYFTRVFDGRGIRVLGYARQIIPCNWKLMFENIKDPYHASLLHVFLVTFGLFRADQKSDVKLDPTGRHAVLVSRKGEQKATEGTAEMRSFKADYKLEDPRLLDPVKEFPDDATVVMQTLFPNVIVQQQSNTLATRQIIPRGPDRFELVWTYFAYTTDDEAMVRRRLRQANLMGPAGLVSVDDGEVLEFTQDGVKANPTMNGILEMGGRDRADTAHMVTEAAIRGFYDYYREVMGL
ncbi:MAG: aromatic ring-hydroxylating dioxygenase subunit alpha [Deltaproteobacteria bacterium]|nr:aromatic ring-hydroxylating dioxygenase subunit alpha [Deltaproteobacteria bacterium]